MPVPSTLKSTLRIRRDAQPADLRASLDALCRQLLGRLSAGISATVVSANVTSSGIKDPFVAVEHEFALLNSAPKVREDDAEPATLVAGVSAGERYHGPRGKLLRFKKQQ